MKSPKPAAKLEKPAPTQTEVDEIREETASTVQEPAAKPAETPKKVKAPAPEGPSPTQAELDAMRAGTYDNREMKTR